MTLIKKLWQKVINRPGKYIWTCYKCEKAWRFKRKEDHWQFLISSGGRCPYCKGFVTQAPLMVSKIPMPPVPQPKRRETK